MHAADVCATRLREEQGMVRGHVALRLPMGVAWLVACAGVAPSALAQLQWKSNVSDAFQHQRWGLPAGTAGIPGGADPGGDKDWQAKYIAGPPEKIQGGGWCFQVGVTNQLYHFSERNYRTFGPAVGPVLPIGTVAQLHDEVKTFVGAFNAAPGATTAAAINNVLDQRGTGPTSGTSGLLSQTFRQAGGNVRAVGSDGVERKIGKSTLFDHTSTLFKNGDMANLRLKYDSVPAAGSSQESLWWRGSFHVVTVAGLDKAAGTMWFADPDSNKGNTNTDAGWSFDDLAEWKAAPAGVPVKQRRYAAADAFAPAGAAPTNAERDNFYYEGKLDAARTEFGIAAGANDRYDGVEIEYLETMETIKGAAKPAPPGGFPAGEPKKFQVTPNGSTNKINEFWIFPTALDRVLTFTFDMLSDLLNRGWRLELAPLNSPDPLDTLTLREFGGARIFADPTLPYWSTQPQVGLAGSDLLEFSYDTMSGQTLSAWDFIYNDSTDLSLESLGVQSIGGLAGYNLPTLQIPSPGVTATAAALGLLALRRRRR
jgi:hypothetical protein